MDSMAADHGELDQIKKEYGSKRKTSIETPRKLFMRRRRWKRPKSAS